VTKLLSEPGLSGRADLNDLTLAATAFAELTKAQIAAAAAAAAAVPVPQPVPPTTAALTPPAATPSSTSATPAAASRTSPAPSTARATGGGTQPPPAPRQSSSAPVQRPALPPPGFLPAAPISQSVPAWQPGTGLQIGFTGAVRLSIDATGKVTNAVMDPSVYPPYDRLVLAAAREWVYRPASQDGQPVASERLVEIVLKPR
jgi:hypothetical protein